MFDPEAETVRETIVRAIRERRRVMLVLEGDAARRPVEGVPIGFRAGLDARERVVVRVADDVELLVLLARIDRVSSAADG